MSVTKSSFGLYFRGRGYTAVFLFDHLFGVYVLAILHDCASEVVGKNILVKLIMVIPHCMTNFKLTHTQCMFVVFNVICEIKIHFYQLSCIKTKSSFFIKK